MKECNSIYKNGIKIIRKPERQLSGFFVPYPIVFFRKTGEDRISLGLDNVFESSTMVRTTYATETTDFENESRFFRRGIRVSFNYNFGKMNFNSPRKKSIRNEDVKGGDGGNGGGQ
ncbi:hypothetical protein [Adhaeribacter soli]|uniref:Uncharacterized protein n=1 Tax=Adhaeribacter soli TaxID=2607655 RepID=A0A5N1J5U6_9BACT|nr:hypothetical protein [Adhaeribacter soli]KAA9340537.1 hypothetical protein F0P94_03670 [Adhaeribacter soli]